METLALPHAASTSTKPELNLLLARDLRGDWRRWRAAAFGSACFHLVVIVALLSYRETTRYQPPPERMFARRVTPLYTPRELTQKAPNKEPVKKELTLESIAPRPLLKSPAPGAKPAQPAKAMPAPPQIARAAPKTVEIEPPKIEAPVPPAQTPQ